MSLALRTSTLPPPPASPCDEYAGLEELDRAELDDEPDTTTNGATLASLDWDDDNESGVKRRGTLVGSSAS